MRVRIECYMCLLERGIKSASLVTSDRDMLLRVAKAISQMLLDKFDYDAIPAVLGTMRENIVKSITGSDDPYKEIKQKSNETALNVAEKLFQKIDFSDVSYDNFRKIIIFAAAANAMEWFIRGHEFSLDIFENELNNAENMLAIDDSQRLYNTISGKNVMYILDNAGEAAIDMYVVKYLRNFAKEIYVGARQGPILNDVTVDEAKKLGFSNVCDMLFPVGSFVGTMIDRATEQFKRLYKKTDIIIAKGMGNYETLTEYAPEKPTFILMKAKCKPIADSLSIPQGRLVIKELL